MLQHILIATDFSPASAATYAPAKQYVELLGKENAKLSIISVVDDIAPASITFEFGLAMIDTASILDDLTERTETKIKELAEGDFAEFNPSTAVVRPNRAVYEEIIDYTKQNKVDHIFVGTHGRSGASHLLLGSVAERVIRNTPVPVTVVPFKE